ncbi:MAG: DNA mismatch repair endonuclease MutL [Anaerolineales bacterium]|nr:DNA mismatch repair endonuclease MutL [Anaerolineales bacterium]
MPIEILSEQVASAIAAGEVVERPVSVVKELIENAIDADANSIEIVIERAGSGLVEVADDGVGIPAEELQLAVARFATSKLKTTEDLSAIRSLGFRGEALSSIGAVSRMELQSRAEGEETGTRLYVEGGEIGEAQSVGAPRGTVVRVRDLFFNVPARRKFLKSEATERRRIIGLVSRYALAYPGIRFRLAQEGRVLFQSTGNGDRREVLAAVYGVETAKQMIALPDAHDAPIQIAGFISPPSVHRGTRRELTFFINGRWVRDASLSAAVLQAYHALLTVGRFPLVVVFLDLPPESLDVNVHPTKAEVRFREQDMVFSILQRVVRSTLLGQAPAPAIQLESSWAPQGWQQPGRSLSPDWELSGRTENLQGVIVDGQVQPALPGGVVPLLRAVGQVGAAYLVAEGPDGLYLIDQHAAHERVLFESLMQASEYGSIERQSLLEPRTIEFTPEQTTLLEGQLDVLKGFGFEVESFGQRTYLLRSVPALLTAREPEYVLRAVVEDFEEDETPLAKETEARIAARVCKRAAVKAGQVLSLAEQQQLLRDLEGCSSPRTCPHGRPTMIHLSVEALERQFGRRG